MPAIAPITGMLRKHLLTHLAAGSVAGVIGGYAFWYGYHVPKNAAYQKAKVEA